MQNVIYKITNVINGKCYIGKTKNLTKRWKQHTNNALRGNKRYPLYDSIRYHGIHNFNIEIVEECDSYEKLNELERHYIKFYDSVNNGYNLTEGGTGGDVFTNNPNKIEIRKKITESNINRYKNSEAHEVSSSATKKLWEDPSYKTKVIDSLKQRYSDENLRKSQSEFQKKRLESAEERMKMSERQRGNKNSNFGKNRSGSNATRKRGVIRLSDSKLYVTMRDAVNDNEICYSTAYLHCNNKVKHPKFQYYIP